MKLIKRAQDEDVPRLSPHLAREPLAISNSMLEFSSLSVMVRRWKSQKIQLNISWTKSIIVPVQVAERWVLGVALSSAILASLADVASLQAGHSSNEAMISQIESANE